METEVCANSVESCIAAQEGCAQRVELCAGIPEGGTTPSYGEIYAARKILKQTKLHVIIRPRGGDFLYTPLELDIMEKDIQTAKELGADGVVFGCLTADGDIDLPAMQRLIKASAGMSITCHRAFDRCKNPTLALEQLIESGCNRILTSGQQPTAEQGIPLLKKLMEQAAGRIIILAGCGINEHNIFRIHQETGIQEFHFSAREKRDSKMRLRNPEVTMGGNMDEYTQEVTSPDKVRRIIKALTDRE